MSDVKAIDTLVDRFKDLKKDIISLKETINRLISEQDEIEGDGGLFDGDFDFVIAAGWDEPQIHLHGSGFAISAIARVFNLYLAAVYLHDATGSRAMDQLHRGQRFRLGYGERVKVGDVGCINRQTGRHFPVIEINARPVD